MLKPGCVPPTIYFRYPDGHIVLAPYSDAPTPPNAIKEYADTVPAVMKLEKILVQQEMDKFEMESEAEYQHMRKFAEKTRNQLYQRSISNTTSQYEKDIIKGIMQLRDEKKIEKYNQRLREMQTWHLHVLHYDLGNRDASKEEYNWERADLKNG